MQHHPKEAILRPEGVLSEKDKELYRLTMEEYPYRYSPGETFALGGATAAMGGVAGIAYMLLTLG